MAIAITKTYSAVEYADLYFKTSLVFSMADLVVLRLNGYKNATHYTDGFLPIIQKTENITDESATASFNSTYYANPASTIATIEAWLIANVAFYTGGSVV